MKTYLLPVSSAVLSTALCVYGCHLFGMPAKDLAIAALVAGTVSLTAAIGSILFAKTRLQRR